MIISIISPEIFLLLSLEIALGPFLPGRPVEGIASNEDRLRVGVDFLLISAHLYFAQRLGTLIYRLSVVHGLTIVFFVIIFPDS